MSLKFQSQMSRPDMQNLKRISDTDFRKFGVDKSSLVKVENLDELRLQNPNIIIAEATAFSKYVQNNFNEQILKKREKYVMSLGIYQQLHYDFRSGKKLLKPGQIKFKNVFKPYRGEDLTDKTILIWRTGGIGDLLFIQPNLRYIKQTYPTCIIKFACGPQYQAMVETWDDCIDELLDLPFHSAHLMKADYHVVFEGVIERCKQAEETNALRLFTDWMGLNLPDEMLIPKQEAKKEKVEAVKLILKCWGVEEKSFVVMQARASSPIRSPRPSFWKHLANILTENGYHVILTDTPQYAEGIDLYIKTLDKPEMVHNFSKHSTTLDYTIALASLARICVGTDSALNHIAVSLGVKSFGIFGPFPGHIRMSTYPKCDWITAETQCSPCYVHGHTPCKNSHEGFSKCYDTLKPEYIFQKIKELDERYD